MWTQVYTDRVECSGFDFCFSTAPQDPLHHIASTLNHPHLFGQVPPASALYRWLLWSTIGSMCGSLAASHMYFRCGL